MLLGKQSFSVVGLLLISMLSGCGGGETPVVADDGGGNGSDSAVAAKNSNIAAGDSDCANGGTLVESGRDDNGNGVLDASEVEASQKVCNSNEDPSIATLVTTTLEPVGANCGQGGVLIQSGDDLNKNLILDGNEITSQRYLCNGGGGISNKPPVITAPALVEISYRQPTDITLEIDDPEDNPVLVSWEVVQSPENGDLSLSVTGSDFKTVTASASVLGDYVIQAEVSDGFNVVTKEINLTVKNFSPVYSELTLYPSSPNVSDSIFLVIGGLSDPDDDTLSKVYHWSINGTAVDGVSTNNFPAFKAAKGDVVSVTVDVSDGLNTVTTEAVSVTLENASPVFDGISFSPVAPDTTNEIVVSLDALNDPDGDPLTVTYRWEVNGSPVAGVSGDTLAAEVAKKDDVVSVVAEISDGFDSVTSQIASVTIADAPTVISVVGLPETTLHGELLEFDVSAYDPDEGAVDVGLAFGPSGMSISAAGRVSWTPNEVMFTTEELFNFGFKTKQRNPVVERRSVTVVDSSRSLPVARSGIEIPTTNHSIWVADYDGDGKSEILLTDSESLVFTLKFNGSDYVQDWLYPFDLSNGGEIRQVLSYDVTGDGQDDIVVVAEEGVWVISDREEPAKKVIAPESTTFVAAAIENIDSDSEPEIALLAVVSDIPQVQVYQAGSWTSEFSSSLSVDSRAIAIGNVDGDAALEIVIGAGYVFDGESGVNEWYLSGGFGEHLAVGDIDDDGVDEILGVERWANPTVFSARLKSELWEITDSDICTINILNVDDDPQEELLVGNCQWGSLTVYDGGSGSAVVEAEWSNIGSGSISVTAGDVNDDGIVEVLWGSGVGSTGENVLVMANISPTVGIAWYNTNPAQLDSFAAAGWATIEPGSEAAVFVIPKTDSGYGEQRLARMDVDGNVTISDGISTNWNASSKGEVVDYDQDGYGEIFFGAADAYDGDFQVRQLNDYSLEWGGLGGNSGSNIGVVEAADVNGDGYEDAIVVDGYRLNVYDIFNQSTIWTSTSFRDSILDIGVIDQGSGGYSKIVVATQNEVSIWKSVGGIFSREATASLFGCKRIQIADLDNDQRKEIICLRYDSSSSVSRFLLLDANLKKFNGFTLDSRVDEFIVEAAGTGSWNLLVASYLEPNPYSYYRYRGYISLISAESGDTVWQSPALPGKIPHRSLYYVPAAAGTNKRLTFSTENAMYISR